MIISNNSSSNNNNKTNRKQKQKQNPNNNNNNNKRRGWGVEKEVKNCFNQTKFRSKMLSKLKTKEAILMLTVAFNLSKDSVSKPCA